jgi:polysaccharide deacetylase family protein (PEP-CTERM system associated)
VDIGFSEAFDGFREVMNARTPATSENVAHPTDDRPLNALSFDIEDWFHLVEIDAVANVDDWPGFPSIVERRTDEILGICDEFGVKATFYYLGWIAERYPQLVRRTVDAGHEIGSHSYWHRKVCDLDEATFREDLTTSIKVIEDAGGAAVTSFRAPSFSITPGTEWAFDVLLDAGLDYDASLFPVARENGGYPCPIEPHLFAEAPSGRTLPELPMSLMHLGRSQVGFSGGGYLRLFPGWLIRRGFESLHRRGLPGVVYLHPRDFAPDSPVVPMSASRRFKSYVGLASTNRKLRMLLQRYRFAPCRDVLRHHLPEETSTCSTS